MNHNQEDISDTKVFEGVSDLRRELTILASISDTLSSIVLNGERNQSERPISTVQKDLRYLNDTAVPMRDDKVNKIESICEQTNEGYVHEMEFLGRAETALELSRRIERKLDDLYNESMARRRLDTNGQNHLDLKCVVENELNVSSSRSFMIIRSVLPPTAEPVLRIGSKADTNEKKLSEGIWRSRKPADLPASACPNEESHDGIPMQCSDLNKTSWFKLFHGLVSVVKWMWNTLWGSRLCRVILMTIIVETSLQRGDFQWIILNEFSLIERHLVTMFLIGSIIIVAVL